MHFNKTLWREIDNADGFWDELKELRRMKAEIAKECAGSGYGTPSSQHAHIAHCTSHIAHLDALVVCVYAFNRRDV